MEEGELGPEHPEDVRVLWEHAPIVGDARNNGGGRTEALPWARVIDDSPQVKKWGSQKPNNLV